MKKTFFAISLSFIVSTIATAQYAPPAGDSGSTAIYKDSSVFCGWATSCYVFRGWQDINDTSLGRTSYGDDSCALGPADNNVVSLGDSGYAIVKFATPISDGPGFDFAVFENAFDDEFLELAFVEVSSDSVRWVRFPSVSLTDTSEQVSTFGTLDATKIYNLAGKYRVLYGTPFDLSEISDSQGIDIQNIKYVKIIDVIGSVKTEKYSTDSRGVKINDPYPTAFNTGGFDLDAVGVINTTNNFHYHGGVCTVSLFPNPFRNVFYLKSEYLILEVEIISINGNTLLRGKYDEKQVSINLAGYKDGLYFVKIKTASRSFLFKIVKKK